MGSCFPVRVVAPATVSTAVPEAVVPTADPAGAPTVVPIVVPTIVPTVVPCGIPNIGRTEDAIESGVWPGATKVALVATGVAALSFGGPASGSIDHSP